MSAPSFLTCLTTYSIRSARYASGLTAASQSSQWQREKAAVCANLACNCGADGEVSPGEIVVSLAINCFSLGSVGSVLDYHTSRDAIQESTLDRRHMV